MDQRGFVGHRKELPQQPRAPTPSAWSNATRPLSDIREITEPSLFGSASRKSHGTEAITRQASKSRIDKEPSRSPSGVPIPRNSCRSPSRTPRSAVDRVSIRGVRPESIPPRSSSRPRKNRSRSMSRSSAVPFAQQSRLYFSTANEGHSDSPVKEVAQRLNSADPCERYRRVPSKTIYKLENPASNDILDHPNHQHPRLKVDLQVAAPIFVGGSSVEGALRIVVDEAERARHRKALTLERVSIDLLGIEEVSGAKRHIFLALGNELIDVAHPPPEDMVETQRPVLAQEKSWILVPSVSNLPFLITLPLEVGPPPFQSKHARIRYVLSATLTIKDAGRQLCVRCTQDTSVLSVYDPEKALISLPSPLTASDDYILPRGNGHERLTVTAGLHRQVWVSGTNIFADVHIVNNSRKTIRKIELQLERIVLCYRHAAAATLEMSASQARLFDQLERSIVCKTTIKHGNHGWNGVLPHTNDLRTCDLELTRGHATIKCNKYFEVRYYLNIIVSSHQKLVTVQLPIILIHMNSLDIPTNSVAQVAAAIEEKRGRGGCASSYGSPQIPRKPSRTLQGRAFSAPRSQSLERQRAHQQEIQHLGRVLESSPRKNLMKLRQGPHTTTPYSFKTPPSNRKGRIIVGQEAEELHRQIGHDEVFGVNIVNLPGQFRNTSRASSALGTYYRDENGPRVSDEDKIPAATKLKSQQSFDFKIPRWPQERRKPIWLGP